MRSLNPPSLPMHKTAEKLAEDPGAGGYGRSKIKSN